MAITLAAAVAIMIARSCDLPSAAGLPGSGAACQGKLLVCGQLNCAAGVPICTINLKYVWPNDA
jgi:hypothetical protein